MGSVRRVGSVGRVDRRDWDVQEVWDSEIALGVTSYLNKEVEYIPWAAALSGKFK